MMIMDIVSYVFYHYTLKIFIYQILVYGRDVPILYELSDIKLLSIKWSGNRFLNVIWFDFLLPSDVYAIRFIFVYIFYYICIVKY